MARRYPFVYGHFPLDEHLFNNQEVTYRWLTVLRDPVDRLLSQFKYWTLTREPSAANDPSSIDRRWEAYLDSELCRYHANLYSYYLGGHSVGFDLNRIEEMKERACANMQSFDVRGCVENLQVVSSDLGNRIGREVTFQRLNSSEANSETFQQMQVLKEFEQQVDRTRLRELTRGDAEIYNLVN